VPVASVVVVESDDGVVEVVLPGAVVEGFAPSVALPADPGVVLPPAAGVDPEVALETLGLAGVVPAGLGFVAGGVLDELDGLGLGAGFGVVVTAGGALLGAPPDPKANPMTLPEGGS
jgi:hypothetical protein